MITKIIPILVLISVFYIGSIYSSKSLSKKLEKKSKISKSNFLRTRLGEIQINILFKSLDEILVSVLRSQKDYMIEWFEVCNRRGTEINFDL